MPIEIQQLAHHRNGVCGAPFHVATFKAPELAPGTFVATLFPTAKGHNPQISVLNIDLLPAIEFGVNSWRGDQVVDELIRAIEASTGEPFAPSTDRDD